MRRILILPEWICYFFAIFAYAIHEVLDYAEWKSEQLMELLGDWTGAIHECRKKTTKE